MTNSNDGKGERRIPLIHEDNIGILAIGAMIIVIVSLALILGAVNDITDYRIGYYLVGIGIVIGTVLIVFIYLVTDRFRNKWKYNRRHSY